MAFPFFIVDAFTIDEEPFTGNQAAIVVLNHDAEISDQTKQKIAAEMNLSETAFVSNTWCSSHPPTDFKYTLRWFTPVKEVDLCGHATLATSRVVFKLLEQQNKQNQSIQFDSKFKGTLGASIADGRVTLDFPSAPPVLITPEQFPPLEKLMSETLGSHITQVDQVFYSKDTKKLLIKLKGKVATEHESIIPKLAPNFSGLLAVQGNDNFVKGIIVTIQGSGSINFFSRYFAPWVGINEDPVTGSAHTVLTPFWFERFPQTTVSKGKQCSSRGGYVYCQLEGDRVKLSGTSRIIVEGKINV